MTYASFEQQSGYAAAYHQECAAAAYENAQAFLADGALGPASGQQEIAADHTEAALMIMHCRLHSITP